MANNKYIQTLELKVSLDRQLSQDLVDSSFFLESESLAVREYAQKNREQEILTSNLEKLDDKIDSINEINQKSVFSTNYLLELATLRPQKIDDFTLNNPHYNDRGVNNLGCGCLQCQKNITASAKISNTLTPQANTTSSKYYIEALLAEDGSYWTSSSTSVTLTYSFMTKVPDYYDLNASERNNFIAFNETAKNGARRALNLWSAVSGLKFIEVSDAGEGGQIRFGTNQQTDSSGWAYFPNNYWQIGGDVWLNNGADENNDQTPGSYGFNTMIHEIGHALGLKHSFEGSVILPIAQDNQLYTVMSYTDSPYVAYDFQRETWIEPETPMLYDIAAIQHLYGINQATRIGNDTYSWQVNTPFVKTIWDAAGRDTISAANQTLAAKIDLNAGHFSSIGPNTTGSKIRATNNLAIAFGVTIENGFGGFSNDNIIGNNVANNLKGNAGKDTILGGAGNDTLAGGSDNDTLNGGYGQDRFHYDMGKAFQVGIFGIDRIADFQSGIDRIILDQTTFNAIRSLVGVGFQISSEFAVVASDTQAASSIAAIVYSRGTGNLFYNQNGSSAGFGTGAQFAVFSGIPNLTATDFSIVA